MPALFRRHSNVSCFFCQSVCTSPVNPRNFCCPTCSCWNRYDENGVIVSEEPAMHLESLNSSSFARRAITSQDQLPTTYGKGPFCHTCQSNQLLLINLLSNYLPPFNDPEYSLRLEKLPEYRESLHLRYPPVCEKCLPAVEDEIQRKNHMARTKALGGWLSESKGKERQRRVSEIYAEKEKINKELFLWRLRGGLWVLTFILTILGNLAGALGYPPLGCLSSLQPALPFLMLVSLLWTAWDPTYSSFRKAQRQGREVRVQGKGTYIKMQIITWSSRLVTSILLAVAWHDPTRESLPLSSNSRLYFSCSLVLEMIAFAISYFTIRLHQPPSIRLIDTNSHKLSRSHSTTPNNATRSSTPAYFPAESEALAALSLSSNPIVTPINPIFGLPSLLSSVPTSSTIEETDMDAMDWIPTNTSDKQKSKQQLDDGSWLRPQRFFAPEKPTGLEGIFERTLLFNDEPIANDPKLNQNIISRVGRCLWNWWWIHLLWLGPLIMYKVWEGMGGYG